MESFIFPATAVNGSRDKGNTPPSSLKYASPISTALLLVFLLGCATSRISDVDNEVINKIALCTGGLVGGTGAAADVKGDLLKAVKTGQVDLHAGGGATNWVYGYLLGVFKTEDKTLEAYKLYLSCLDKERTNHQSHAIPIDYFRTVDFSKLGMKEGKKYDVVVFEDTIKFAELPPPGTLFSRTARIPRDGDLKVEDLVAGYQVSPQFTMAGGDKLAEVTFQIDRTKGVAHFKWTYTNVYGQDEEGVGFARTEGFVIRNVHARYLFPRGMQFAWRKPDPPELVKVLQLKYRVDRGSVEGTLDGENVNLSEPFRDVWGWNVWHLSGSGNSKG